MNPIQGFAKALNRMPPTVPALNPILPFPTDVIFGFRPMNNP
uniref:Uncharacterized protein n=1 Tax=mine drainage metagenome TaxID=410659 RepID=E6QLB0_9ZZZZ